MAKQHSPRADLVRCKAYLRGVTGARVKYNPATDSRILVQDHGSFVFEATDLAVGTLEGVGSAYLYSLRLALLRHLRYQNGDTAGTVRIQLSPASEKYFDPRSTLIVEWIQLLLRRGEWLIEVEAPTSSVTKACAVGRLLEPLFARRKTRLVEVSMHEVNDDRFVRVTARWPTKGQTVRDAWKFGREIESLLHAAEGGQLTAGTTLDLLRARRWSLLHGQSENDWLDAKIDPYNTKEPNWRYELAKDVAAFANAPDGGLIVIGMSARDVGDGDVITGHREIDLRRLKRQTYRSAVAQLVYPRVQGFAVERIEGETRGHGVVVLVIPPQPESSRPFLVQGFVQNGDVLGAHVLLLVRREDDTALLDASALHARLRLGEQVIAGRHRVESLSDE